MADVVLVDAGGTNIGSVRYALQRLGADAELTADPARIRAATHVILPGVGAAPRGMARLREAGLVEVLRGLRQPVLGVCLGMQLLCESSEEGDTLCLDVVPGRVAHFKPATGLRIPHMGWNTMRKVQPHRVIADHVEASSAYFVHSYALPLSASTLLASTHGDEFSAVVAHDNFVGMQFHPERSADVGARLMKNFLEL
jgi:glutamine amidotransferase